MKKLFLTSLLAVAAVSGAHAANVIDGNPLYMPSAGHFYSVSTLGSHTETEKNWTLGEEFGYGITDKFAINVATSLSEVEMFDDGWAWNNVALNATFRAYEKGGIVADIYGGVDAGADMFGGGLYINDKVNDAKHWMDKDFTGYTWTAGLRLGYTTGAFTIAGHAEYIYLNSEAFNWNEKGMHKVALGLDGQFVIDSNWNLVAGAEYTGVTNDKWAYADAEGADVENAGIWTGYFGVNYNIDATKFVGAYINGSMNHHGGDKADEWIGDRGYGFGFKFGIDF
ncbi:MAG: hypothetical protein J6S74_02885 [Alphaproteobacteria bacterium]|nr:hypothetical protein [Alphaproteobacteria bacterium]